jgi:serine/threonine protein kinase
MDGTLRTRSSVPKNIGPYEVLSRLGNGGMGEVFLCNDTRQADGPVVAVKTVFPELLQDESVVRRFQAEAMALGAIRHANVVRMYESGQFETNGHKSHYMAMEYIDGVTLFSLCRQRRLSFPDILRISIQIAEGLEATHIASVIHRDLKPGNVMVTKEGVVKIIDFGIAKPSSLGLVTNEDPSRGFKTQTGMFIGTVNYVAPEILRDLPASQLSDIYGLGLILWEMLSARTPFKADNAAETIRKVTSDKLKWSASIRNLAPPGYIDLVDRMLAKDPFQRPGTAHTAAEELRKVESAGRWSGIFNRKTRFDLEINWSQETIAEVKTHKIEDGELPFVLQEIEDRLAEEKDPRLLQQKPIIANPALIGKCVNNYRRARFDMVSMRRTQAQDHGGVINVSPEDAMVMIEKVEPPLLTAPRVIAIALAFIVAGVIFMAYRKPDRFQNIRISSIRISNEIAKKAKSFMGSGSRTIASEHEAKVEKQVTVENAQTQNIFKGRTLVYRVTNPGISGAIVVSQETRVIADYSESEIIWQINENDTVRTPRSFLPVESYFHPFFRRQSEAQIPTVGLGIFPLVKGRESHTEISDYESASLEKTRCTPISSRQMAINTVEHEIWQIDCVREITRHARTTHIIIETYRYSPSLDVVIASELRARAYDDAGIAVATEVRRIDLQPQLSRLRPTP